MGADSDFPSAERKGRRYAAFAGAIPIALLLFLLIPLTQSMRQKPEKELEVREVPVVAPPPPPSPPEREQTRRQKESPPEPASTQPAESLSIGRVNASLDTRPGEAMKQSPDMSGFAAPSDAAGNLDSLFRFEDLQKAPRLVDAPPYRFPRELVRRGVREGRVVVDIEILPDGSAKFRRIVSSTHPELEAIARRIIRGARFTRPKVEGEARRVRGHFPLILKR